MERWKEVFIKKIPKGVYQLQMSNSEKQGLTIELSKSIKRMLFLMLFTKYNKVNLLNK